MPRADPEQGARLTGDGWKKLKEPGNMISAILLSVPLMALNLLITGVIVKLVAPASLDLFTGFSSSITIAVNLLDILGLVLLLVGHELLHLVLIPDFARSRKTWAGITYVGAFVVTEEVLTRQRFLLISVAPFIVISVLLPLGLGLAGMLSPGALFFILLNSIASSVDILSLFLVLIHVPRGSQIVCNGSDTYWKAP